MVGNMIVLVICDNKHLFSGVKYLCEKRYHHTWEFKESKDVVFEKSFMSYYDLVLSVHCKKIFPPEVYENVRCINVHPGLSPYNRGMFPHVWSIINGLPAGVTIHEITGDIDLGPWIHQHEVKVKETDTSESLYNRILDAELKCLEYRLDDLISGEYEKFNHNHTGNYNSLQDFKRLCNIDGKQVGTFREFYNLLRALSHGDYKNAHIGDTYLTLKIHENGNP
jgi:methionyl-tRNA formyltransferase